MTADMLWEKKEEAFAQYAATGNKEMLEIYTQLYNAYIKQKSKEAKKC